jgi:ribosome-associated translation inhibitor RaiA
MNIDWTFRGEPLDDDIQQRIGLQLTKLERLLRGPVDARVVVKREGPTHQRVDLEVVVTSKDGTFAGHGEGHEIAEVTKGVLHRVEAQVQRVHDKRFKGRRHAGVDAGPALDSEV